MVYPQVQYQGPAYPDRLQAHSPGPTRELDSRANDDINVQLLWHPRDGHASVVPRPAAQTLAGLGPKRLAMLATTESASREP
jgi:hypothetical protein